MYLVELWFSDSVPSTSQQQIPVPARYQWDFFVLTKTEFWLKNTQRENKNLESLIKRILYVFSLSEWLNIL